MLPLYVWGRQAFRSDVCRNSQKEEQNSCAGIGDWKGKSWFWLQSHVLWVSMHPCSRGFLLKLLVITSPPPQRLQSFLGCWRSCWCDHAWSHFIQNGVGWQRAASQAVQGNPVCFCRNRLGDVRMRSGDGRSKREVFSGTLKDRKFQMSSLWMFCVTLLMTININDIFLCDGFSSWLTQKKTGHTGWLQSEILLFRCLLSLLSVFFPSFYFSFLAGH